jgi:hypothetical protein
MFGFFKTALSLPEFLVLHIRGVSYIRPAHASGALAKTNLILAACAF